MKRTIISLLFILVVGLGFPGTAFCGGKSEKNAAPQETTQVPAQKETSQDSAPKETALTSVPAAPAETILQDTQIVAEIQVSPDVTKETIFRGQFKSEVERLEKGSGRPLNAEERRQVLDVMINEKLANQAAKRDKITVSEGEINQQIQQLRTGMVQVIGRQPTDAEFAMAVWNETGLDESAFREQLRRQLVVQKYLQTKKQNIFESLKIPTEEEIQNTFNLARSQFVRPDTVRLSMIQVSYGSDAAAKTRARELADRLFREINANPTKFDELVLRGQAQNSGYQAGDWGYLPRSLEAQQSLGADFVNTAFSLKQGEVSKLIEGTKAYHIIKVTETHEMKNLELDDIYQLGSRFTVRDYIGNSLLQRRQQEILAQASQELVAELRAGKTFQVFEKNLTW